MCLLLLNHPPTLLPRRVQLKKSTSHLMTRMMSLTGSPLATSAIAERPTPDSPAKRKGKATTGKSFGRDIPSSLDDEAEQRPAKRQRIYHVILY
ncbi:hypothetical protein GQ457_15G019020 [Hibiscus cannabinus]